MSDRFSFRLARARLAHGETVVIEVKDRQGYEWSSLEIEGGAAALADLFNDILVTRTRGSFTAQVTSEVLRVDVSYQEGPLLLGFTIYFTMVREGAKARAQQLESENARLRAALIAAGLVPPPETIGARVLSGPLLALLNKFLSELTGRGGLYGPQPHAHTTTYTYNICFGLAANDDSFYRSAPMRLLDLLSRGSSEGRAVSTSRANAAVSAILCLALLLAVVL